MNNSLTQFRHSIIYGAIFGSLIVFLLFFTFIFGMLNIKDITSLTVPIYAVGAFIAVKHFRDKVNDGYLSFGKAFQTSLIVCITMGVVWGTYQFILYKYLSPDLMIKKIEDYQEEMLILGFSEKFVELNSSAMSPFTMGFGYISNSAILGSLLSLIIAALLKRNINPLLIDNDQNL